MKEKRVINYYRSFYEISKKLSKEQFHEFNVAIFEVMFFDKHIDDISFSNKILDLVWTSVYHSIKSSVKGFCSKKGIDYDEYFHHLGKGVEKSKTDLEQLANNENGKDNGKEKENTLPNKEIKNINNEIKIIIDNLNKLTGKNYEYDTKITVDNIKSRLKEGNTTQDFLNVNECKTKEWSDSKMEKHLNPITLYGNKFAIYKESAKIIEPKLSEYKQNIIDRLELLHKNIKDEQTKQEYIESVQSEIAQMRITKEDAIKYLPKIKKG